MKKVIVGIIVLAIAVFGTWKYQTRSVQPTTDKPVVKIGINLPLTGDLAFAGDNMKKSLDMAMEDLKKQNLKYAYELIIEDNAFESKKTVMNLNKFKSIDKVNAIMSLWGTSGTISSDFATKNKIVHMSCSCSDVVSDGFYNFNHSTKPMTHMKRIVEYYKKNNYKKIGLLYVSVLEVEEFMRDFKPLLEKEGFEIVFSTAIHPGEKDLKTEIMKMKDKQPDVVYLQILPPALITFAKQHKELGFNVPLTNMNVFSFAPDLYEGAIYFTESEGTSDFGKEFTGKTGLNQMSCTINMYDGLKMIVDGYEKDRKSVV